MEFVVDVALVGVVSGLVEVIKRAGMPTRFAGLAAVLIGIMVVAVQQLGNGGADAWQPGWMIRGFVTGLAASGLYSQVGSFRSGSTTRP